MGILLKVKLNKIKIYPFGGLSKLDCDININLYKELLIVLLGPITQLIFTYLVFRFKLDVPNYFYSYSKFILLFNLLPIYPLDGGKIINIFLNIIFSFYNSLKYTYYISYFNTIIIFIIMILFNRNLTYLIIIISIITELFKEMKKSNYYFNKFLLERYLNNYQYKRIKKINKIHKMFRNYSHIFIINGIMINERKYLNYYFEGGTNEKYSNTL